MPVCSVTPPVAAQALFRTALEVINMLFPALLCHGVFVLVLVHPPVLLDSEDLHSIFFGTVSEF